jgi:hypothetical protein
MVSPLTKRRVGTERHMQQHGIPRYKAYQDLNTTSGMHWAWEQNKRCNALNQEDNIKAKCILVERIHV